MSIPIIGKEEDLEGCVAAPVLLQEIVRVCSEQEALKKPVTTMLQIFAEMAQYAAHRNDPGMNFFALRLGLFPMSQEDLKKALDYELQRLKAFPNGEPQGPKETEAREIVENGIPDEYSPAQTGGGYDRTIDIDPDFSE